MLIQNLYILFSVNSALQDTHAMCTKAALYNQECWLLNCIISCMFHFLFSSEAVYDLQKELQILIHQATGQFFF